MEPHTYKPSVRQNVAAWLMLGGVLLTFLLQFALGFIYGGHSYFVIYKFVNLLSDLLPAVAWLLLALSASNLSGRLLGYVFMGLWLFDSIFVFVPLPEGVWQVYVVLLALVQVWLYGVLLQNNRLSAANRTWVVLMPVLQIASLAYLASTLTGSELRPFVFHSEYYAVSFFVVLVKALGLWHVARCEAFAGHYDGGQPISLVPALKPSLAFGIGFVLMLLLVLFIYGVS